MSEAGPGAERILSTVLFTDIVGSTDRAAQLGDRRWRDLLDRHDQSVRTADRALPRARGEDRRRRIRGDLRQSRVGPSSAPWPRVAVACRRRLCRGWTLEMPDQ